MRTIRTKIYKFEELTKDAQEVAIEEIRNGYYQHNNFAEWAIDDCSLLEPLYKEMVDLFGADYDFPLLENTREKLYYSTDRDWFIDISNAMKVTDTDAFYKWLGIDLTKFEDDNGFSILDYKIGEDTIEFETDSVSFTYNGISLYDFTDEQNAILDKATEKFENHCDDILRRLQADIEYRFTDEAIKEDIESNDYEFLISGKQYS